MSQSSLEISSYGASFLVPLIERQLKSTNALQSTIAPRASVIAFSALMALNVAYETCAAIIKLPVVAIKWTFDQAGYPVISNVFSGKTLGQHLSKSVILSQTLLIDFWQMLYRPADTKQLLKNRGIATETTKLQQLKQWVVAHRAQLAIGTAILASGALAYYVKNSLPTPSDPSKEQPPKDPITEQPPKDPITEQPPKDPITEQHQQNPKNSADQRSTTPPHEVDETLHQFPTFPLPNSTQPISNMNGKIYSNKSSAHPQPICNIPIATATNDESTENHNNQSITPFTNPPTTNQPFSFTATLMTGFQNMWKSVKNAFTPAATTQSPTPSNDKRISVQNAFTPAAPTQLATPSNDTCISIQNAFTPAAPTQPPTPSNDKPTVNKENLKYSDIQTECGHFIKAAAMTDGNRAVLNTGFYRKQAKQLISTVNTKTGSTIKLITDESSKNEIQRRLSQLPLMYSFDHHENRHLDNQIKTCATAAFQTFRENKFSDEGSKDGPVMPQKVNTQKQNTVETAFFCSAKWGPFVFTKILPIRPDQNPQTLCSEWIKQTFGN